VPLDSNYSHPLFVRGGVTVHSGVDKGARRGPFGRLWDAVPSFLDRELRLSRISDVLKRRPFREVEHLLTVCNPKRSVST